MFQAYTIWNNHKTSLGYFHTPFEAKFVESIVVEEIFKDIYKNDCVALMIIAQRYDKLKYDYDNFLETKSLYHY